MLAFVSSAFLSAYYASLVSFSFVSHPVGYCVLLVINALSVCGFLFVVSGVSWYVLLFCLVYVGGVYVLFIFVSIHNPNFVAMAGSGAAGAIPMVFVSLGVFVYLGCAGFILEESSHYICTFFEGVSYCFLCLVVLVGFGCVSVVTGSKGSFFR